MEQYTHWKMNHFIDAISNSRTAIQLQTLSREIPGWEPVIRQLLIEEPLQLNMRDDTPEYRLMKTGLICHVPGSGDQFTFGNPAIRLLLFQQLLYPAMKGILSMNL